MLTVPPPRVEALAVNVTEVPGQIAPAGDADMVTTGVTFAFTVMLAPVAVVAVVLVKQEPPEIEMSQVIVCDPTLKAVVVNVLELLAACSTDAPSLNV